LNAVPTLKVLGCRVNTSCVAAARVTVMKLVRP
jgi:hypothetical protein